MVTLGPNGLILNARTCCLNECRWRILFWQKYGYLLIKDDYSNDNSWCYERWHRGSFMIIWLVFFNSLCPSFSGLTLTLSTLIEGKTFNQGGHKVGAGLEFEAWAANRCSTGHRRPAIVISYAAAFLNWIRPRKCNLWCKTFCQPVNCWYSVRNFRIKFISPSATDRVAGRGTLLWMLCITATQSSLRTPRLWLCLIYFNT